MPFVCASSCPKATTLICHDKTVNITQEKATIGRITYTIFIVEFSNEPINQYVIVARVVVGSAKYFTKDKAADMNPPTIIPANIKVTEDPFLNNLDIAIVINTVKTPITKENKLINTDDKPRIIAIAAPTAEPELTPSKSGDVNLFWNIS